MTTRRARTVAAVGLAGALVFCWFFFAAKHEPRFARLTPFGEDPQDAVGSFAIQLAFVAAVLSAWRSFRLGRDDDAPPELAGLIARGVVITFAAIHVTVAGDLAMMLRHPDVWKGRTGGAALFVALVVAGAATAWGALGAARAGGVSWPRGAFGRTAAAVGTLAAIVAWYPDAWRQGLAGALLTALAGMLLMFGAVWVATRPLLGSAANGPPVARTAIGWRAAVALAFAGGAALALVEAYGEGLPSGTRRALLVLGVFTGIEGAGILTGFALFGRPLGLRRARDG